MPDSKTINVPGGVHGDFKIHAAKCGLKMKDAIVQAIRGWIAATPARRKKGA